MSVSIYFFLSKLTAMHNIRHIETTLHESFFCIADTSMSIRISIYELFRNGKFYIEIVFPVNIQKGTISAGCCLMLNSQNNPYFNSCKFKGASIENSPTN